jgi:hypothetical protein
MVRFVLAVRGARIGDMARREGDPEMNICAVRLATSARFVEMKGDDELSRAFPHEPAMHNENSFVWPVHPHHCDERLRLCKHCGCVYREDK